MRERNPELTRERLLAAATVEFAEKGLKGARTQAIARRAGKNQQALYHHFGSKDKLYTAVLASLYANDWFQDAYPKLKELPPIDAVLFLIDFIIRKCATDVHYVALLREED